MISNKDEILDRGTLSTILEHGYSRIPVYDKTRDRVFGLLLVKDLANVNAEVKRVNKNLPSFFLKYPLHSKLNQFEMYFSFSSFFVFHLQ
jgi:CBS domain containing-hemolysin-like protein